MDKKQLWPTLVTVAPLFLSLFTPAITEWVSSHAVESMTIYTILTSIANLLRPPMQPKG